MLRLHMQAVVVTPSQELCMQTLRTAQQLLPTELRGGVQHCIGGANPVRQKAAMKKNKPFLVIGTPGRLANFINAEVLRVSKVSTLVIDEVRRHAGG